MAGLGYEGGWARWVGALVFSCAASGCYAAPAPTAPAPAHEAAGSHLEDPIRATLPREVTLAELVARVSPSVVNIVVEKKRPPKDSSARQKEGAGSGFVVASDGYVVTNEHVVHEAAIIRVQLHDDRVFEAEVVGRDPELDLALLHLEGAPALPAVRLGDSSGVRIGEHVLAVGNPFGLGHTVTLGIVSGKARSIGASPYDAFIQTDAPINPGNSGGPLFNLRGEVVGINTAIRRHAHGISFAIPVGDLSDVLPQLRARGFVERGRLGLRFQPVGATLAKALGLGHPRGALINAVEPDSPAARAGLKEGDVVVAIDGERVRNSSQLPRLIAKHQPGTRVRVRVRRNRGESVLTARLDRLERQVTELRKSPAEEPRDSAPGGGEEPLPLPSSGSQASDSGTAPARDGA